jgi:hypothetical protein
MPVMCQISKKFKNVVQNFRTIAVPPAPEHYISNSTREITNSKRIHAPLFRVSGFANEIYTNIY